MSRLNPVVPATLAVAAVIAVAVCLAVMSTTSPARADDLCVGSAGHATIQDTINKANDQDTVMIPQGTYTETLVITEDITLEGGWDKGCGSRTHTDPEYTTIDGGAVGSVVSISGGSTATLDGLTLTNGQSDKGGGVYVLGASPTLSNVVVTGNVITATATPGWIRGGGVYVEGGNITLTGCEITHNVGEGSGYCYGAGLALYGSNAGAVLEATKIMSNSYSGSESSRGGGIWLYQGAEVTFEGTENLIAYNEAKYGGGVYMHANTDLQGVTILDNHAFTDGGGIYSIGGGTGGKIANNYLLGNTAGLEGDSVYAGEDSSEIANNTIVGVGDLSGPGAGVYILASLGEGLKLTNNIVVSHTTGIKGGGSISVTLANNDVWGNSTNYGAGVSYPSDISEDPLFVDPENGDYHLTVDSPCRDAGTTLNWLLVDYDGDERGPLQFDIGADEYLWDYVSFVPLVLKSYAP